VKSSISQSPELRVLLERGRAELVRAVVREACLSEGVSPAISGLIADDTAQIWQALCRLGSGSDRVRLEILCSTSTSSMRATYAPALFATGRALGGRTSGFVR
jgi:hypothetical protein